MARSLGQKSKEASTAPLHQNEASLELLRGSLRSIKKDRPDPNSFALLLEQCCRLKALREGKRIHSHMQRLRLDRNTFLANFVITMYGKCGSVSDARKTFDTMHQRNTVSWNAMISVYAEHGQGRNALRLLSEMQQEGLKPKKSTYITALNACTSPELLPQLVQLHQVISKSECAQDLVVGNSLIHAYGKCGSVEDARKVFRSMSEKDIITFNSMIAAYSQNGCLKRAFKLFQRMSEKHLVKPDKVTLVNLLSGCTGNKDLEFGKTIHELIVQNGYQSHVHVGTALITMFGKCGCIESARQSFNAINQRSIVSWNAMIVACIQCGCANEAVQLFKRMQKELIKPNSITFATVLDACTCLQDLDQGRAIHECAKLCKLNTNVLVRSALINMYGKCGSVEEAHTVFDQVQPADLVSWTALIGAYGQLGQGRQALKLFGHMILDGLKPNEVTYINTLSACANLAAAREGKMIHCSLVNGRFESVLEVSNALINMYAKCGSVEDAQRIFNMLSNKNIITWTATLDAFASNGYGKEAIQLFKCMLQEGIKPDEIIFVSVLTACSRSGLVNEAWEHFYSMSLDHGILPNSSHSSCMIDMFGRLGQLHEAEAFLNKMPFKAGVVEWMALLGACKNCGDLKKAEHAAEQVFLLDPQCSAAYVTLFNMYTSAGRSDDAEKLKTLMVQRGIKSD